MSSFLSLNFVPFGSEMMLDVGVNASLAKVYCEAIINTSDVNKYDIFIFKRILLEIKSRFVWAMSRFYRLYPTID